MRAELRLSRAEIEFLTYSLPAHVLWPPDEGAMALLAQVPGGEVAGGPRLRALLLAAHLHEPAGEGEQERRSIRCTAAELWLFDSLLLQRDLRREKLPDGTLLVTLAEQVWRALRDLYADELPPELRRDSPHANDDTGANAYPDAGDTIASAEALLRSRHGEGAG